MGLGGGAEKASLLGRQTVRDRPPPSVADDWPAAESTLSSECDRDQPAPLPSWRLVALAGAMGGIQVCYAAQIGHGSAALEGLGLPGDKLSYAWIAGPLSGVVVQPVVGVLSDRCYSSLGRRRPFLIGGAAFTTLALLFFGNALPIGRMISGDPMGGSVALVLAVVGFFLLDFSIQAIQGPLRALVTDVAPPSQQNEGNSYFALMVGVGNLFGSLLGAVEIHKWIPIFESHVQALFTCAAVLLVTSVAVCCYCVKEQPIYPPDDRDPRSSHLSDSSESAPGLMTILRSAPHPFWRVFAVQCFTWYGFFTLFIYATVWVGENVYLGDSHASLGSPKRNLYEEGVRLGNLGLALNAVITVLYALFLPWLLERLGNGNMYLFSQLVQGFLLMSAVVIHGTPGQGRPSLGLQLSALLSLGSMGIAWASTMTIPWALMGRAVQAKYPSRVGLLSTIFNLSQSGPQFFVSALAPPIVEHFGGVAAVMFSGGILAVIGGVLVPLLRVDAPDETPESEEYRQSLLDNQFDHRP